MEWTCERAPRALREESSTKSVDVRVGYIQLVTYKSKSRVIMGVVDRVRHEETELTVRNFVDLL